MENESKKRSIRADYNEQVKTRKLSLREEEKIKQLGARSYYSSRIMKLRDGIKVFNFSGIIMMLTSILMIGLVLLTYLFSDGALDVEFYIYVAFAVIMVAYSLACYVVFIPLSKKNINKYTELIAKLREEQSAKQNAIYDYLLKNQNKSKEN
ncbi:MAG: hypothetical protein J6R88_03155 [Clostridia bacterium]|nr:hypothetical protein [Clostridia bacterium]